MENESEKNICNAAEYVSGLVKILSRRRANHCQPSGVITVGETLTGAQQCGPLMDVPTRPHQCECWEALSAAGALLKCLVRNAPHPDSLSRVAENALNFKRAEA